MNKIVWSVLIILILLFCVAPCNSATLTDEQMKKYQKKMDVHQDDIIPLLKSANYRDTESGINISDLIEKCSIHLTYIQSIFVMHSFIQNHSDRKRVKPVINVLVKYFASDIEIYVEQVNTSISRTRNQAVILALTRLRGDLRELKELLDNCD